MLISLRIEPTACGPPRKRQHHETRQAGQQVDSEVIPGFTAQGVNRIHYGVRPRPHLMTEIYTKSVKRRVTLLELDEQSKNILFINNYLNPHVYYMNEFSTTRAKSIGIPLEDV